MRLRSRPKFAKNECRVKVACTKNKGQPGPMMGRVFRRGSGFTLASFFWPKVVFLACGRKRFGVCERHPLGIVAPTGGVDPCLQPVEWSIPEGSVGPKDRQMGETRGYPSIVTEDLVRALVSLNNIGNRPMTRSGDSAATNSRQHPKTAMQYGIII